jgi:hypothetical protein
VVEKRWRVAWEAEGKGKGAEMPLPEDYEVAAAFANRRRRYCVGFIALGVACFGEFVWSCKMQMLNYSCGSELGITIYFRWQGHEQLLFLLNKGQMYDVKVLILVL